MSNSDAGWNFGEAQVPTVKRQIAHLKNEGGTKPGSGHAYGAEEEDAPAKSGTDKPSTDQRLDKLERLLQEMSERLKSMDKRLPPPPKP